VEVPSSVSEHIDALANGPRVELAVASSEALRLLTASGAMARLLMHTRIWARTKPEDKVAVVKMHIERNLVCTMAGDGGNDCGALRSAHAGLALSEAEASVVSPFTSRTWSIVSVVDLVREGRAALTTAFGSYKLVIIYGLYFSILKLFSFYYGVILSNAIYLLMDTLALTSLTATMALSQPLPELLPKRPPASLLGRSVVSSVLGVFCINTLFCFVNLHLMSLDADYIRWPAQYSTGADWWMLADNWESTVLFASIFPGFVTSAAAFSLGGPFRRPVFANGSLVFTVGGLLLTTALLLLLPQSDFTEAFHIAQQQFNAPCPEACYASLGTVAETSSFDYNAPGCGECPRNPVWLVYQQPLPLGGGGAPSPAMSFNFRLRLWLIAVTNCTCIVAFEKFRLSVLTDWMRTFKPAAVQHVY
jgi:magnesium-transporting ATPase (P-type)